jgi:hypothetical protein
VIGFAAAYLAGGQTGSSAVQQADSMPRESAGTL